MDRPASRPGPPVDAARLQPDNQADIQHVDEGLVDAWLDDPDLATELADELERVRRLQADEELLLALQLEQFTGRMWERFSRELSRYGLGVLRAWIRRGTIYGKAKALTGYGLGRIEGWPDDQTIDDIAADTVVAALIYFRDKVLRTNRWQASGGASLGTFFIGQCLYQFANIYRSALRAERERIQEATTPMAELPEDRFDIIKGIEETIVTNNTVAEAMALLTTDRARRALFLQEYGFSQREIADELGLPDAKSVENLIGYQLRQLRKRTS
ncbi:RNA polymerase sigma factor [Mycolicibacter arupensis]|jgi:DNA-directed RNA polymerase specialized sigma24 family protein|uniref:RNA polymerase sigma factor n=1 Tax=Mycolicibacter arupensis TaxID=342002 RepID=UPI00122C3986|nr:sigma-70 family RNA polymerase sigma factor [Mycolicibacter arupensis]KAA1427060.1 sigma-70 family RNA polymerase sigma factor [Mycolicibacter arupensis]